MYLVWFTSCDALLTTELDGLCSYVVDTLRERIFVDSRQPLALQIASVKAAMRDVEAIIASRPLAARLVPLIEQPRPVLDLPASE